jgi:hypothetical protein
VVRGKINRLMRNGSREKGGGEGRRTFMYCSQEIKRRDSYSTCAVRDHGLMNTLA